MFGEMKIRHLIGVTALFLVPTLVFLFFLLLFFDVDFEFVSATFGLVLYVLVPVVFFGYHFRRQNLSIRQVVYTKGVTTWIPSIFVHRHRFYRFFNKRILVFIILTKPNTAICSRLFIGRNSNA